MKDLRIDFTKTQPQGFTDDFISCSVVSGAIRPSWQFLNPSIREKSTLSRIGNGRCCQDIYISILIVIPATSPVHTPRASFVGHYLLTPLPQPLA